MDTAHTFDSFWATYFAPRYAAELAAEAALRDEAFAPCTITVCGLELRPLTAADLLLLDGIGSPFVAGGPVGGEHIAQFLSLLVEPAPRGWWARRRFFRHCRALRYGAAFAEIQAYLHRFLPPVARAAAGGAEPPPEPAPQAESVPLTFLVPLIVQIACETGWPEADILAMRVDRLRQYKHALDLRAGAKVKLSPAERLKSDCLAAWDAYRATGQLPAA